MTLAAPSEAAVQTHVDFATLSAYERYKLMASLIVPRPIALVTTLGPDGVVNAAPFSMFAMLGEEPPLVMISVNRLADGALKDTAANILRSGEFVVHMADEDIAEQMHGCGVQLPAHESEIDRVGFGTMPSASVAPPRIADATVAFECVSWDRIETESRYIFFGRILHLHARAGLVDTAAWRVNLQAYFPVGRFGASFYTTTRDRFALDGEAHETPIDRI